MKRGSVSPLASASAVACSPSLILSCSTTETEKIISSMSGFVIVESMYIEEVELYLTRGDDVPPEAEAEFTSSAIGRSAFRAITCAAVSGRRLAAGR